MSTSGRVSMGSLSGFPTPKTSGTSPLRARFSDEFSPAVSAAVDSGDNPENSVAGRYLPALDGVRALAILTVIAYHLGYGWASGGYLGVYLFFVLSGFLIPSLLVEERATAGLLRFGAFWGRRARRLLPALLLM